MTSLIHFRFLYFSMMVVKYIDLDINLFLELLKLNTKFYFILFYILFKLFV